MEHGSIRVSVARLICRTYVSAGSGFISIYVEQYAKQATAHCVLYFGTARLRRHHGAYTVRFSTL